MKNYSVFLVVTALLLSMTGIFTGCKDEDDPVVVAEQAFSFHLHTKVGTALVEYGVEFQDSSGRKFTVEDLRYYISNIVLIKSDGSQLPLTGKVILASPTNQNYALGKVPVGSYDGFRFMVGLDSVKNHSDPTTYPSGNPLAIQSPSIHWSWNSGYIFMKFDGEVDTTLAGNGSPTLPYFYHVGADDLVRTVDFSGSSFEVVNGSDCEIVLEFDLLKALANVDMRVENSTHTMDNMPLAIEMADNWQGAFHVE